MPSKVQICNLALAALGHKAFIQSIDEESMEAKYAKLFYETARRETLRAHPWNFAKKYGTLALLGTEVVTGWYYQYALPIDCVKARYLTSAIGTEIPFEVAISADGTQKVVNTNEEDAELAYTFDLENTVLFDDMFVGAFALKLAAYMAEPVTGNTQKTQAMTTRFVNAIRSAETVDASEGEREEAAAPDWIEARLGTSTGLSVTTEPAS